MRRLCIILMAISMMSFLGAIISHENKPEEYELIMIFDDFRAQDMIMPIPRDFVRPTPVPMPEMVKSNFDEMDALMNEIPIELREMIILDEHRAFLTAYCAEECGWNYWTSSGAYCHRSSWENRIDEPTTCAIDLRYFDYGDLFYIPSEDRIYIAEDTGAFRGIWLDLYQSDMSSVRGYDTRHETIYSVTFEYYLEPAIKYDAIKLSNKEFLNIEEADNAI